MANGYQNDEIQVDQGLNPEGFNMLTYMSGNITSEVGLLETNVLQGGQEISSYQVYGESIPYNAAEFVLPNQSALVNLEVANRSQDLNYELSTEKLTTPGVDFQVKIADVGKNYIYTFSNELNKIFTKINKPCTFEVDCNASPAILRIMLVCSNVLYQPLVRCQDHLKGDTTALQNHVVVRKDGKAEYVGTLEGASYGDRLALKIPIESTTKKTVVLEFKCLSSCYKISKVATALVFTLEDPVRGQLLGREVIPIQISKNFKRDMETAEKRSTAKRVSQKRKQTNHTESAPVVKEEPIPSTSSSTEGQVSVDLMLNLPPEVAQEFLKYSEQFFAAKLYGADESTTARLEPCLKKIKRIGTAMKKSSDQ